MGGSVEGHNTSVARRTLNPNDVSVYKIERAGLKSDNLEASISDEEVHSRVPLPPPELLTSALTHSEQIKDKVEQCATDLSSVNLVLRQEIVDDVHAEEVARAILLSEKVEAKVQECAEQLAVVNDALAEEIDERQNLDRALSTSNFALLESKAQEEQSMYRSLHDAVTGLPNLSLFNDRLNLALTQTKRHKRRLAVMFIDLDKFKSINDTHGHDVGDDVLKEVARRLQGAVREGDTVSRRSGDEFLLLMLDANDENSVVNLAMKIVDCIGQASGIGGTKLSVRPSVGIALYPEHGQSPMELLKNADFAMYAAKQRAEGYAVFNPLADKMNQRTN
jgi:diguanylate cyclase (GGDEF)-like protein